MNEKKKSYTIEPIYPGQEKEKENEENMKIREKGDYTPISEIKEKLGLNQSKEITTDNPAVAQTKIIADAVKELADDQKEVFTTHFVRPFVGVDETISFETTYLFADAPLTDLEQQVRKVCKDDSFRIDIPVLKDFCKGVLRRRHSSGNKRGGRIQEYLDALENMGIRNTFRAMTETGERESLGRRRIV